MQTNKRKFGNHYEQLAAEYLKNKGIEIIAQNFFCKVGEIDLICKDENYLCFVEVKYRKDAKAGTAIEAVNFSKMKKICKAADYYLMTHNYSSDTNVRFDVIAIQEGHLDYIKNAFEYII